MDTTAIAQLILPLPPEQRAQLLNQHTVGLDDLLGVRFSRIADDEVVATLAVTERHLQPYGLVHGGIYATLAETVCSVGAAFGVMATGHNSVGVENATRFLKATRSGATLTAVARPVQVESERQLWEARMTDERGRLVAVGRVQTLVLEPGASAGGERVAFKGTLGE